MAGKEDSFQFRCSTETKRDFKRMLSDIAPIDDHEAAVERIIDVYNENPSRFRKEYR